MSRSGAPTTAATTPASPIPTAPPADKPGVPSISISDLPSTSPSPSATATGKPKGLAVSRTRVRGRSASASWDIAIPVFSGPAAANEANRRVRAAVDDLIAKVRREAADDRGVKRTLTGTGTVGTNDGRTVQVTIMFADYLARTAHPASFVTTTVVDIRRVRPVPLTQVIQNPPEGLRFLRAEVVKVAKAKGESVDSAGLAPKVANWANWQASPAGLTFPRLPARRRWDPLLHSAVASRQARAVGVRCAAARAAMTRCSSLSSRAASAGKAARLRWS